MSTQTLVPDPDRLEVLSLRVEQGTIILTARTCSKTARCPICGQPSARVHSRYRRRLADLPWQEIPARLILWARRLFCDTCGCPRRIFTQRLSGVAAPHARCTNHLRDWLRHVAFALGGEPGRQLRQIERTGVGIGLHAAAFKPLERMRATQEPLAQRSGVETADDGQPAIDAHSWIAEVPVGNLPIVIAYKQGQHTPAS